MKIRGSGEDWYDTFMITTLGFIALAFLGVYVWFVLIWWPLAIGVPLTILVAYALGRLIEHRWVD